MLVAQPKGIAIRGQINRFSRFFVLLEKRTRLLPTIFILFLVSGYFLYELSCYKSLVKPVFIQCAVDYEYAAKGSPWSCDRC